MLFRILLSILKISTVSSSRTEHYIGRNFHHQSLTTKCYSDDDESVSSEDELSYSLVIEEDTTDTGSSETNTLPESSDEIEYQEGYEEYQIEYELEYEENENGRENSYYNPEWVDNNENTRS